MLQSLFSCFLSEFPTCRMRVNSVRPRGNEAHEFEGVIWEPNGKPIGNNQPSLHSVCNVIDIN